MDREADGRLAEFVVNSHMRSHPSVDPAEVLQPALLSCCVPGRSPCLRFRLGLCRSPRAVLANLYICSAIR